MKKIFLLFGLFSIACLAQEMKTFNYKDIKLIDGQLLPKEFLANKTIIVNLWGTRCAPCIKEIPALNDLANKYKSSGNVVFFSGNFVIIGSHFSKSSRIFNKNPI